MPIMTRPMVSLGQELGDRIGCIGLAGIELRDDGGDQMTAGGRAHYANAGGIKSRLAGKVAHGAHGAGGINEHVRVPVAVGAEAVLQHPGVDALGGEPVGVDFALVGGEHAIATARKNDDTGAG